MAEGALAGIACERTPYERAGSEHFFVRLRVTNRGARELGLDLRDYWFVPRPSQCGGLRSRGRGEISERRRQPAQLDEARRRSLRAALSAGSLERVPAGSSVDLYVEFSASGRSDVDKTELPYLFVSLDGQLFVTDGASCEDLSLGWERHEPGRTSPAARA